MTLLKHVASIRVSNVDKKSYEGETPVQLCNYTDVYYGDTLRADQGEYMRATASAEQIRNFGLQSGDTVLTKDSETARDIGISAYIAQSAPDFICGYHLAIIRPDEQFVDPRFMFWASRSTAFTTQLSVAATGVTRFGLRTEAIANLNLQLPAIEEQRRIARLLDDQVARLDRIVALRKVSSRLTDESFTSEVESTLQHSVSSRVPLKRLLKTAPSYGVLKPDRYEGPGAVPLIRTLNVTTEGTIDTSELISISPAQDQEYSRTRLACGDIALSVVGTIGRSFIATEQDAKCNLSRALARLTPRHDVGADWVRWWLRSSTFTRFVDLTCQGTAQSVLNMSDLAEFPVGKPNSQSTGTLARLRRLDEERMQRQSLATKHVLLLEERKQALITAAVTGQFDVTAAQGVA